MAVVSLRDVVEALDLQSDELRSFLDPDTGEIITFSDEEASMAERDDWEDAPEWMREFLPKVKRALEDDRMLELPDQVHIDEWRMMQEFADGPENCHCRAELMSAAQGPNAFRRFRDAIARHGLEETWHLHRQAAYTEVAREWLKENGISYQA